MVNTSAVLAALFIHFIGTGQYSTMKTDILTPISSTLLDSSRAKGNWTPRSQIRLRCSAMREGSVPGGISLWTFCGWPSPVSWLLLPLRSQLTSQGMSSNLPRSTSPVYSGTLCYITAVVYLLNAVISSPLPFQVNIRSRSSEYAELIHSAAHVA